MHHPRKESRLDSIEEYLIKGGILGGFPSDIFTCFHSVPGVESRLLDAAATLDDSRISFYFINFLEPLS